MLITLEIAVKLNFHLIFVDNKGLQHMLSECKHLHSILYIGFIKQIDSLTYKPSNHKIQQ